LEGPTNCSHPIVCISRGMLFLHIVFVVCLMNYIFMATRQNMGLFVLLKIYIFLFTLSFSVLFVFWPSLAVSLHLTRILLFSFFPLLARTRALPLFLSLARALSLFISCYHLRTCVRFRSPSHSLSCSRCLAPPPPPPAYSTFSLKTGPILANQNCRASCS